MSTDPEAIIVPAATKHAIHIVKSKSKHTLVGKSDIGEET